MNENQAGPSSLLDTTDCLEAISVFRGWKNFFFIIVVLCLLLLQICFWAVNTGYISAKGYISNKAQDSGAAVVAGGLSKDVQDVGEAAKKVAAEQSEPVKAELENSLFGINFNHLAMGIRLVNAILVLTGLLYCLTILLSLKISLVGRLGGMNHISRAFFLSLVMLVLLLPWQEIFGCMVRGAIYTPCELAKWSSAETGSIFDIILYYLRFSGYWLLILLLLIFSQLRSGRWTKSILRRLEVI
ncbi:MAG: hypothetical protein WAV28_14310 [Sedimentisphaerales bacterium]|jgi:hypothetical protein